MRVEIGLAERDRVAVVSILNALLADEYVLYTKTRNYHWNIVGPSFHDLHKFFEAQYGELDTIVDDVAERARALGGPAFGTLAEFVKSTRLRERPGDAPDAPTMIEHLLADHESITRRLRVDLETCTEKHRDAGTTDFLTGLLGKHEKMAWMLRASREGDVREPLEVDIQAVRVLRPDSEVPFRGEPALP
jgi:starvation-inducible DNA-binding protein